MQEYAITPYEGTQPYIFISYAHKDSQQVYPIVEALNRLGYRVWYDAGISPGSEWPEDVAQHLDGAHMVISMVSPQYVVSDNCLRELQFSIAKRKPFLAIFLEETTLTLGLEMQLSAKRCIMKYNYPSEELFIKKMCSSPDIAVCCGGVVMEDTFGSEVEQTAVQTKQSGGPKRNVFGNPKLFSAALVILGLLMVICLTMILPENGFNQVAQVPITPKPIELVGNDEPLEASVVVGDETNTFYYEGMTGDYEVVLFVTGFMSEGPESPEMVYGAQMLELTIPEMLNGYRVYGIEQGAFQNAMYLKKITLPANVTGIGLSAFNGCSALEEFEVLGETGDAVMIDAPAFAGCTSLKKVILPGRVTTIDSNAFIGCSGLKELVLPDTLKTIELGAFKQTGLEDIQLPDSVKTIEDSAFESCSQLRTVALPKSLEKISYRTFYDCAALESIWIPSSVTAIEEDAFFNCSSLQHVYFEGTEKQWNKLMAKIDFNQPEGSILRNNMALQKAEIHFDS